MALTAEGLTVKRFTELHEELNADIKQALGSAVDVSENSLIGHLHSAFALRLAELYELSQNIYDAGSLYDAEGTQLDSLVLNVGVRRKPATQAQGYVRFTGLNGVVIPAGSRLASAKGDEFITKESFQITSQRCLSTRIYIGTVVDNTDYTLSMAGSGYTIDSGTSATQESILTAIGVALDAGGITTNTVVVDALTPAKTYLLVDKTDKTDELSIQGISYLKFDFTETQQTVYSKEYGAISGDADAVTKILSSVTNWYSAVNPVNLTTGTDIEDDNALRLRAINEFNAAGSGTVDSIVTGILRLDGVKDCIVKENTTSVTVDSVPPKSYEVIVNGGIDSETAKVIWDNKPAGIYTHGSNVEDVVDFNGYTQQVRFSPATPKYITVRVSYSTYTEEDFPSGSIDAAKEAILKFANDTLTMDDDIIAKRFLGVIYASATGFGDIDIEVAMKDNPNDTVLNGDYTDHLAISDREFGSFSSVRLVFQTK